MGWRLNDPPDVEFHSLFDRVVGGDREAEDVFFRHTYPIAEEVSRSVWSRRANLPISALLNNPDDLTEEVVCRLLELVRSWPGKPAVREPMDWAGLKDIARMTARNVVRDETRRAHHRRGGGKSLTAPVPGPDDVPSADPDPVDLDVAVESAAEFGADVVGQLRSLREPEPGRRILSEWLDGLTPQESAARSSLTADEIAQRRSRLREKLRGTALTLPPLSGPDAARALLDALRAAVTNPPRPTPTPRPADPPPVPADPVECSVYCPPRVRPAASFLVRAFVHRPDQAAEADRRAREYDDDTRVRGRVELDDPVPHGATLTLHLTFTDLAVADPVQRVIWRGRPAYRTFEVKVPAGERRDTVSGRVAVARDGAPLGHITFQVRISQDAAHADPGAAPSGPAARGLTRYRRGFASYASKDRDEVLRAIKLAPLTCEDVFLDVVKLRPGEQWRPELERRIDECDLFLLFWSKAAQKSRWVRWEIRRAWGRKNGNDSLPPAIYPVMLEGPPPPRPPEELSHLHFDDYYDYFRTRTR
jgi:DNA-directed RNA polymerase specialized sigma24 family protein